MSARQGTTRRPLPRRAPGRQSTGRSAARSAMGMAAAAEGDELRPVGEAPARPARAPSASRIALVIALARRSASRSSVIGPKLLGARRPTSSSRASISRTLPAGHRKEQAVASCARPGRLAARPTCSPRWTSCPAEGIDFSALAIVLALVMVLYVGASLFAWLQGYLLNHVVQRTVRRLRAEVEAKLMRAAAGVLRPAAARRGAQPRHQRHRQRRAWRCSRRSSQMLGLAADRGRRPRHDRS